MTEKKPRFASFTTLGVHVLQRLLISDWKISLILFLLAFMVRIPYLYDVPRFIDEWREIGLSAQIARGEAWPLHNTSHDIGPFHNYALAGLFSLFGYSVYLPRLYVVLLSAETVVLTYWIARHWTGRMTALIAASLLAVNSMHILVTHMAWSNDTTPFFVALAVLLSLKTLHTRKLLLWVVTGLAWALALQTHPSVSAALAGVLFYLFRHFGWRTLLRESRFRMAATAFLAGYSNMIVHNIIKPFDSFLWIKRKDYALNQELSIQGYLGNVFEMGRELIYSLSSAFPDGEGWLHSISFLMMVLFMGGLIAGFWRLFRFDHGALLLSILISSLLVIPFLNDQYMFYVWTRYIAYLFPLCFIAIAIGWEAWIRQWLHSGRLSQWNLKIGTVLASAWAVILILPLHHFYSYAESYIQSGRDNSAEFLAVQTIQSKHTGESVIAVDKQGKQAEAISKMLRVKGYTSPVVGMDPNEVREVQAIPGKWGKGIDFVFYTKWRKTLTESKPDTWYVLSLDTKRKITDLFNITWENGEIIKGKSGKEAYFIGRISSFNR